MTRLTQLSEKYTYIGNLSSQLGIFFGLQLSIGIIERLCNKTKTNYEANREKNYNKP